MATSRPHGFLLDRALEIYGFYTEHHQDDPSVAENVEKWTEKLRRTWPCLLPSERRAWFDALLEGAAKWACTKDWPVEMVDFHKLLARVCGDPAWPRGESARDKDKALSEALRAVQRAYRARFPQTHSRKGRPPTTAADVWATLLTKQTVGTQGVSQEKLHRLGPVAARTLIAYVGEIERQVKESQTSQAADFFLISADELLEQIDLSRQSPQDRLNAYGSIVGTAAILYTHDLAPSRVKPDEWRSSVMVDTWMSVTEAHHLARFELHDALEQCDLVDEARRLVFGACRSYLEHSRWLDADDLAQQLLAPLEGGPEPQAHVASGSEGRHSFDLELESLAHVASAPRMSPYYARKYYGGSSLARQVRMV